MPYTLCTLLGLRIHGLVGYDVQQPYPAIVADSRSKRFLAASYMEKVPALVLAQKDPKADKGEHCGAEVLHYNDGRRGQRGMYMTVF